MRTTTALPLRALVTFTLVPKRSERCAAVSVAGFMRSPEAVLEFSAYHEAPPQPVPALASSGAMMEQAAIVAAAIVMRRIFVKLCFPDTRPRADGISRSLGRAKNGEKVPLFDHEVLRFVIFVIVAEFSDLDSFRSNLEKFL